MNKKLFIFIVFLLLINLVVAPSEDDEYDSSDFYRDSNPEEWVRSKIKWPLVPDDKIKDIPVDILSYPDLNDAQKKAMTAEQIIANVDNIEDLTKDVNKERAQEAIKKEYDITVDLGDGANLKNGILSATYGNRGFVPLPQVSKTTLVKIDENGNILLIEEKKPPKEGLYTAIYPKTTSIETPDGKQISVDGKLSYRDGQAYVRQGDIASINGYKIDAFKSDVNVIFDGGKRLELLKIQAELNNALNKGVWTVKAQALYLQRESIKNSLGIVQASSSQILTGIDGSNQNSVIFDSNAILVNGNGFRVADGVKIITPQGGNILSIKRDEQTTLYGKIKGNGRIANGNFDYSLGEQKTEMGVKPYLSESKPTGSTVVNNEPASVNSKEDGIRVEKGQTASGLIGPEKAVGYDTIYTYQGTSRRGSEMLPEDFRRLREGTIISFDPDTSGNKVEVTHKPNPVPNTFLSEVYKGFNDVIPKVDKRFGPDASVDFNHLVATFKVESDLNPNVKDRGESSTFAQLTVPAVLDVDGKYGTRYAPNVLKYDDEGKPIKIKKDLPPEIISEIATLYYGVIKSEVLNVCKSCSLDTINDLTAMGYNLGYPTVTQLISKYNNENNRDPTTNDLKNYLTKENLRAVSPKYYGKWSNSRLDRKIGLARTFPDKVRNAMVRYAK